MDNPLLSDTPAPVESKSAFGVAMSEKLMEELNRLKNEKLQKEIDELKEKMQPKKVVKKKPKRKVKKVEEKEIEPLVHPSVQPNPVNITIPFPEPAQIKKPFFLKRWFTRNKDIKVFPHPPNAIAPIQRDSLACQDMEFADVRFCPKCSGKLDKSSVFATEDKYIQYVKCSDIKCDFYKKIEFKR